MLVVEDDEQAILFKPPEFYPQFERLCGIDWGKRGGFVWNEGDRLCSRRMPLDGDDISSKKVFELLVNEIRPTLAYGEKVDPIPNQSSIATGTFQREIGRIEGLLVALGVPLVLVRPAEWLRYFTERTKKDFTIVSKRGKNAGQEVPSTSEWKKYLLELARMKHPQSVINLECADACLIWRFAQDNHAIRVRKIAPPKFSR